MPVCIGIENVGNTNFYPGAEEELPEKALRQLAVGDNRNFLKVEGKIVFSFSQLADELEKLGGKDFYSSVSIVHSLTILCCVSYEISNRDRRMGFCPINWRREKEIDGETYYMVQFSSFF